MNIEGSKQPGGVGRFSICHVKGLQDMGSQGLCQTGVTPPLPLEARVRCASNHFIIFPNGELIKTDERGCAACRPSPSSPARRCVCLTDCSGLPCRPPLPSAQSWGRPRTLQLLACPGAEVVTPSLRDRTETSCCRSLPKLL